MTQTPLPGLRRIRWAVRATLTLGIVASVAANILHARANPISQVIAAWPPCALLLTVELISRIPVARAGLAVVRLAATAGIAGIAAWVSYWHMAGVAEHYGESGAAPYLLPFSVDGLVVVASVSLVELAGRIRAAEVLPEMAPVTRTAAPAEPAAAAPAGYAVGRLTDDEIAELHAQQVALAAEPEQAPRPPRPRTGGRRGRRTPAAVPADAPAAARAARAAYAASVAEGRPLSGRQLADRFGRKERWGRMRIQEAKRETLSETVAPRLIAV